MKENEASRLFLQKLARVICKHVRISSVGVRAHTIIFTSCDHDGIRVPGWAYTVSTMYRNSNAFVVWYSNAILASNGSTTNLILLPKHIEDLGVRFADHLCFSTCSDCGGGDVIFKSLNCLREFRPHVVPLLK